MFEGLEGLERLALHTNNLTSIDGGVFTGLANLRVTYNVFYYYHPPKKLLEGDVFTRMYPSVCPLSHVTITHDSLGLTVQPSLRTWDLTQQGPLQPPPLLVTSSSHRQRSAETRSLQNPSLVATETCTIDGSGRYASYWNVFLFKAIFLS